MLYLAFFQKWVILKVWLEQAKLFASLFLAARSL